MKFPTRYRALLVSLIAATICAVALADATDSKIAALKKQIAALKSDRDDLQTKADRLSGDLKDDKSDRGAKNKSALAKTEKDLKDATADLADANSTIYDLEHKSDVALAKKAHKKIDPADQAKYDKLLKNANAQKKSDEQRVDKLKGQRDDLKHDTNAPSDDEKKNTAALNKTRDQIDSDNSQIRALEKQLADLQKSADRRDKPTRPAAKRPPAGDPNPPGALPTDDPTTEPTTLPTTEPTTLPTIEPAM